MSLEDYVVKRDHFVAEEYGRGFNFPCNVCIHRTKECQDEPCRSCDHNDTAERGEQE